MYPATAPLGEVVTGQDSEVTGERSPLNTAGSLLGTPYEQKEPLPRDNGPVGPALHHTCRAPCSGKEVDGNEHMLKASMCQALCAGALPNVTSCIPPKVLGESIRLSQVYR